jgi:hypothetical protein
MARYQIKAAKKHKPNALFQVIGLYEGPPDLIAQRFCLPIGQSSMKSELI